MKAGRGISEFKMTKTRLDLPTLVLQALLVFSTVALAWYTSRLVVATYALKDSQEAESQRLRPRIRIQAPNANFGDLLPTGPIDLHIVNEGQQETTLSSLQISVRDSSNSSHGYPIQEPIDLANGNSMPFPIRIPGAADVRLRAKVAGGSAEVIKGSRVEWEGKLTRGEILDPVIRDVPAKSNE
jgi:hypothetical protein